jgi:ABC-type multidrug transport system ATPase subunit
MSERILKALMQLFAIIAKVDGVTNTGRDIVQSFLKQQLNQELVDEYLRLFDQFLEGYHNLSDSTKKKKRTSVNSVKVLKICTEINQELAQKQKVVVVIRLIEFINSSGEISEQELEFVQTVASTFNISDEEFNMYMNFINAQESDIPDSGSILVLNSKTEGYKTRAKHMYNEALSGEIRVLSINSVNMYVLRYFGKSELNLNGLPLSNDKIAILNPGASIRSSKVNPIYYSDIIGRFLSDTTQSKIVFQAKDVEFRFKSGKLGMIDFNMLEESGKMLGIMGGSGAGKSTLLNILNGNDTPSKGGVYINGINIHKEKNKIEGVIGMVSQDDLLIEELTVFQNLFYNAKLCFDGYSDEQLTKIVLDLLIDLGLYETRDLKVGSPLEKTISGGQRKRLNIGLELIREPSVLFVDEPTSGLSSRDSENIMDLLKELALKGKLVFVVIHQPSSEIFKMFDKLIILDLGGFPIYNGNPVEAIVYFKTLVNHVNANESECPSCGNVNPEQIFNIIESKVIDEYGEQTLNRKISPKEWNEYYKEKNEATSELVTDYDDVPKSTFNIPNKFKQFKVFITRDVRSKLTNTQYLIINLFEAPVLGFILAYLVKYYNTDVNNKVGYIFRENENMTAYIFMSVVVALFIGLTVSAEEIIRDRRILKRESFLNLSKGSYLFSKISIMFLLSAIQSGTFVLVGNSILEIKGMYLDYWLVLFTTSCFANMLGLNISASFNSAVTIYILIPFLIIPQLLLSGVIVKFEKLNPSITSQNSVPFAGEIMTSRWAFEALAVNQFKKNDYERNFYKYDKELSICDYKKNFWIGNMKAKVDRCENNLKDPGKKQELDYDLSFLKNEIEKEQKLTDMILPETASLVPGVFNTAIGAKVKTYLENVNTYYKKRYNNANNQKDKRVAELSRTPEEREKFRLMKDQYENESLSDLVRNNNEVNKILEIDGSYIQRADPVFLDPKKDSFVNAHFYAPRKMFFGRFMDTFWVNMIVIWFMSLTMAVTLYFDLLKKLLDSMESLTGSIKKALKRKK